MITILKSTSRGQVREGDDPCGGSLSANLRVNGQKQHIRPNPGASKHNIAKPIRIKGDGKCCDCVGKVHVLTRGDLLSKRYFMRPKRLEDRYIRSPLLLSQLGCSALDGNIEGDEAEVSRGRENLIDEIEGPSAVWAGRSL